MKSFVNQSFQLWPCLLVLFSPLISQAEPALRVDEPIHDYGVQYLDEVRSVSHTFYLTNEGDEALQITGTHPSCGCTRADLSGQTIEPGGVETLTAEFSFERYTGKDQVRVTIDSNDPETPALDLGLQGFVIRKWHIDPPQIDLGVLPAGSTSPPAQVVVTAQRKLEETEPLIETVDFDPQRLDVTLVDESDRVVKGAYREKIWQYEVRVRAGEKYSNSEAAEVEFNTNGGSPPGPGLSARWKVEGDLEVEPRQLNILKSKYFKGQRLPRGSSDSVGRVRVRSKSSFPIEIEKVTVGPPFEAEALPVANVGEAWVTVRLESNTPGIYPAILSLFTNHPEERQFDILLDGIVEDQKPIFSADGDFHHFGKVFSERVPEASHTFTLRNSGNRPLHLTLEEGAEVTAILSQAEVAPGSSTSLLVRKGLTGIVGPVSASVTVLSNDFERPRVSFSLQGEVLPQWRIEPEVLVLPNAVEGKEEIGTVQVEEWFLSWERPKTLRPVASKEGNLKIEIGDQVTAYSGLGFGTAETEIRVHLIPDGNVGWNREVIRFETVEGSPHPIPPLSVDWDLLGQLRSLPRRIVFSTSQSAKGGTLSKDIKVYALDGSEFQVERFEAPAGVTIQPLESTPKESFFTVTITDTTLLAGQPEPKIVFFTNKPDEPRFEVVVLLR